MSYPWFEHAKKEMGISEIAGKIHNARILQYHSHTTLSAHDDETPWCASFICCMLEETGFNSTKSAAAKSYLNYGDICEIPEEGCIVVLRRYSTENPNAAHVGFFDHQDDDYVYVLGGNQSNKVCIQKFPKKSVLAYRMPIFKDCADIT